MGELCAGFGVQRTLLWPVGVCDAAWSELLGGAWMSRTGFQPSGKKLRPKQETAILALLTARTIEEAATAAGIRGENPASVGTVVRRAYRDASQSGRPFSKASPVIGDLFGHLHFCRVPPSSSSPGRRPQDSCAGPAVPAVRVSKRDLRRFRDPTAFSWPRILGPYRCRPAAL
jgi:hypothetical protein